MTAADQFLLDTDPTYSECTTGIRVLDQIIVSTPTTLVGRARASLVPALYAYWERFFRVVMGEFLRAVSLARVPVASANVQLVKHRIKAELRERIDPQLYARMMSDIDARAEFGAADAAAVLQAAGTALDLICTGELAFADPDDYVVTDSNVRYEVVEKNFRAFGIEIEGLRRSVEAHGFRAYPDLKDLVDTRNQIAHGQTIAELSSDTWNKLRDFTLTMMFVLQEALHDAIASLRFRRSP